MDEHNRFRQPGLPQPNGQSQSNGQYQSSAQYQPLAGQQYTNSQGQVPTLPPIQNGAQYYSPINSQHSSGTGTPTGRTPSTSAPSTGSSIPPLHQSLRPIQPTPTPYMMSGPQYGASHTSAHIPGQHPLPMAQGLHGLNFNSLQSQYHGSMLPHAQQAEPDPVHVVGQQGRRGVLPTHPGRPPPSKQPPLPTKNADNKYECPHCTKTYLHLKHLKRHLLRHTGERPYQCALCKDTFSRSDILKRHFQKCSIRRGNPNGVSHLQHAQSHLRNRRTSNVDPNPYLSHMSQAGSHMSAPVTFDSPYGFSAVAMPSMASDGSVYPEMPTSLSNRPSRSNSLNFRPGNAVEDSRNNRLSYNGSDLRQTSNLSNGMSHGMNAYPNQTSHNGGNVSGNVSHYNSYEHSVNQQEMSQGGFPTKTEDAETAALGSRTLTNGDSVSGIPGAQESNFRWNGSMNSAGNGGSLNGNGPMTSAPSTNNHATSSGDAHGSYMMGNP